MHVQITRNGTDLTVSVAGGPEVELLTWTSDCDEETGQPLLTLMLAPDSLSVGERPTVPQATERPDRTSTPLKVWGDKQQRDPRERIPGWSPDHDHTLARWTCGCDPVLLGIQEAAEKTGNIALRVAGLGEQVAANAAPGTALRTVDVREVQG